jgi:hypothetical protein
MVSAALLTIVVLAAFAIAYDDTTLNSGNFMKNTQRSISRAGYNINPLTKEHFAALCSTIKKTASIAAWFADCLYFQAKINSIQKLVGQVSSRPLTRIMLVIKKTMTWEWSALKLIARAVAHIWGMCLKMAPSQRGCDIV